MRNNIDDILKNVRTEPLMERGSHFYNLKNELHERAEHKKKPAGMLSILTNSFSKILLSSALVFMVYIFSFGFIDGNFAKGEVEKSSQNSKVIPQEIDEQVMYPSSFITPDVSFFESGTWTSVSLPEEWVNRGYYYEVWNGFNRPLSDFTAKKLVSSEIDISSIEVENYGTLRFVLFVPKHETFDQKDIVQFVNFHWTLSPDTRLIVVLGLVLIILLLVTILAFIEKITDKNIITVLRGILLGRKTDTFVSTVFEIGNQRRTVISLTILVMFLGGLFGAAVGLFMGNIHIVSILVKFPILVLGTYLLSSLVWYLFSTRMSSEVTFMESIITVLLFLSRFSLILVSLIPVVVFFIYSGINHDQLLLVLLVLLVVSLVLSSKYLFDVYRILYGEKPAVYLIASWLFLYGLIGLQLAWMLRPWVGLQGEYDQYIPFMRLYSGNVFEEILVLIARIITGGSI